MALNTHSSYIKICEAVLSNPDITLDNIKQPSFDPHELIDPDTGQKIVFTEDELLFLKRYWGLHPQLGMRHYLVEAWLKNQHTVLKNGVIKNAFDNLKTQLAESGISTETAENLFREFLDEAGGQ